MAVKERRPVPLFEKRMTEQSGNLIATEELAAMLYEEVLDKDAAIAALSEMIAGIYEGSAKE